MGQTETGIFAWSSRRRRERRRDVKSLKMGDGPPLPLNPHPTQRGEVSADPLSANFPHSSSLTNHLQLDETGLCNGAQNWCTTKSRPVRFSATWTIRNFSLHFERGVSLESGVFTSGDAADDSRWCLKLHMSRQTGASSSYSSGLTSEADPNAASDHNYNIPHVAPRHPVVVQQLPPNVPPDFQPQRHNHYPAQQQQQQQLQPQQHHAPDQAAGAQQRGPHHPPPPPPPPPAHQQHEPLSPNHNHHHHHNYHVRGGEMSASSSSSQSTADESISLYLCLLSTDKPDVWAKYKFCILDENLEECIAARPQSRRFTPGKRCGPTLRSMDTSRQGRFLSEILYDDQLIVSCQILVVMETQNRMGVVNKLKIPECTIGEDLSSLLDSSRLSDVTVNVKGKDFHLHQNILAARSPVFRAMFDHDMLESCQRHVDIPDISIDVMKDLVRFIYTGVAPNLETLAPELLAAADKYGLTRLKLQCESHLSTNLSATNVCELLVVADLHDSAFLRKEALQFLVNNANQVMTTAGYRTMESSHPQLVSEAFRLLASMSAKGNDGETASTAKRVKLSD